MKKKILNILLIGFLMMGLTGCGKIELKNDWAKKYEEFLKAEIIDQDFEKGLHSFLYKYESYAISFINLDDFKNPILIIKNENRLESTENDSCIYNIAYYYIDNDNKVNLKATCDNETELKLLYDIEDNTYKYALYYIDEDSEESVSLLFISDIETSTEDADFRKYNNVEYSEKFIEIDLNLEEQSFNNKIIEKDLLKTIQYLTEEEKINTITEDNKKYVEKKLEEIKIAEEEEAKKKEEEKSKVITAGKYTLQYGYYKNINTISESGLDITINPDNTCTYQRAGKKLYGTDTCTYEIKKYSGKNLDGSSVSGYHIIFHITGQTDIYFKVDDNNTFIDQSAHLVYQGAEKK